MVVERKRHGGIHFGLSSHFPNVCFFPNRLQGIWSSAVTSHGSSLSQAFSHSTPFARMRQVGVLPKSNFSSFKF